MATLQDVSSPSPLAGPKFPSNESARKGGGKLRHQSYKLISNLSGAAKLATVSSTSFLVSAVSKGFKGTKNSLMGLMGSYNGHYISEPNIAIQEQLRHNEIIGSSSQEYECKGGSDGAEEDNVAETHSQDFYSGYLHKWTNYYGGYRKRFFAVDPIRNTLSYYKSEHDWPDRPRAVTSLSKLKVLLSVSSSHVFLTSDAEHDNLTDEHNAPLKFDILIIKPKTKYSTSQLSKLSIENIMDPKFYIWHLKADTHEQAYRWISLLARLGSKSSMIPSIITSPFSRPMSKSLLPANNTFSLDWDALFSELMSICNNEIISKYTFQAIKEKLMLLNSCREEELRMHSEQISCLKEKLRWLAIQSISNSAAAEEEGEVHAEQPQLNSLSDTLYVQEEATASLYDEEESITAESDMSSSGDDLFFECESCYPKLKAKHADNSTEPSHENGAENCSASVPEINKADDANAHKASIPDTAYLEKKESLKSLSLSKSLQGYPKYPRRSLSQPASIDLSTVSVWSILKQAIGKDLSRLCVPIQFNEPLTMLQRVAEDMEYWHLITRSIREPDPEQRLLLISAFALSVYSTTWGGRLGKPFNPLLNETFEFVCPDPDSPSGVAFRYISEQVSHHPPISASHAEGEGWILESETRVKMSFWGKYISLIPAGSNRLIITLPSGEKEVYSWKRVTSNIYNVLIGKLRIDHSGEMDIVCHSSGYHSRLVFIPENLHSNDSDVSNVRGHVFPPSDGKSVAAPSYIVEGTWYGSLWAYSVSNHVPASQEKFKIWEANARPECSPSMFHFTEFAMQLNELTPELMSQIAPTDSRWRPDQRALEEGRLDDGIALKDVLEKRQRKRRNASAPQMPIWFVKNSEQTYSEIDKIFPVAWSYLGGYWEARESQSWSSMNLPEIFPDLDDSKERDKHQRDVVV